MNTRLLSLIFFTFLLLWKLTASGQSISGNYSGQELQEVLEDLAQRYELRFYYKTEWIQDNPVNEGFENQTLSEAISRILQGKGLKYFFYTPQTVIIAPSDLFSEVVSLESLKEEDKSEPESNAIVLGEESKKDKAHLEGRILNQESREGIKGASLAIVSLETGVNADQNGQYELDIPPGEYIIRIKAPGLSTMVQNIDLRGDAKWDIEMDLESYRLDEVLLEATASNQNVSSAQIGTVQLGIKEIKRIPALLGEVDVIKSIILLPGVSTVGEGASGFNVRGGNIDQNLILQNEAPIFNSSHVLGFFSIFNPDVVSSVTLYKGNIPAQYGGRLASVLDVNIKDGDFDRWQGRGGLGLISSRIAVEGPIVKKKLSLLTGLRVNYSDWVLGFAENQDLKNSSLSFYDINGRLSYNISDKDILALSYYRSRDRFQFSDQYGYGWETSISSANWRHLFSNKLSLQLHGVYGNYVSTFFEPGGPNAFELENGLDYAKGKINLLWNPGPAHLIHLGAEYNYFESLPEQLRPLNGESLVIPETVDRDLGQELGLYINHEWEVNSYLSLSAGLRYSHFNQLGPDELFSYEEGMSRSVNSITDTAFIPSGQIIETYSGFEPRLSARISLDANSSIKLSYNRMRQYIHLISNTTAATPVDLWQVSNTFIPPQIADNYSIGYFRNFTANTWEFSLEAYYRDIDQIIEYKDLANILLNPQLETVLLTGEGRAYGAELMLRRNVGKIRGSISYAYSRSERRVDGVRREETINEGEWYPAPFDQPHQIDMYVSYLPSKKHTLSLNFTYSSGRPITAPVSSYLLGTNVISQFSLRNQFRIPDYHRLDFSYTYDPGIIKRKKVKGTFVFTLYNVYARRNAFSVFFRREAKFIPDAFRLAVLGTVLPAITYNFTF